MSDHENGDWANLGLIGKAALTFCATFVSIGLFGISVALPGIQAAFAATPHSAVLIQVMAAMAAPVFAVASPVAGKIVSRFGVRETWIVSVILIVISGIAPAFCTELWQILPLRLVLGCAVAGVFTAGMTGIARVPVKQQAMMFGLVTFFGGGISIFAFPLIGLLAAKGWQYAFAINLALLPIGLLGLALPRHRAGEATAAATTGGGRPKVPLYLLYGSLISGWAIVASTIYAPFLLASVGVNDPQRLGNLLAMVSICSLAGSGTYGFVHRWLGTGGMLLLGLAEMTGGAVLVGFAGSVVPAVLGIGIIGAGISVFSSAVYPAAFEAVAGQNADHATTTGVVSFAVYLPQLVFPFIGTAVAASYGPGSVYLLLGVLVAAGFLLAAAPVLGARKAAVPA